MNEYQIGRHFPTGLEWETLRLQQADIIEAMLNTLKFSDDEAQLTLDKADKKGDDGVWINNQYKIRAIKPIEITKKTRKKKK